ncbi:hypothetical protein BP6252_05851 [Coleophoma cylindrospora]|uniref:Carboxylic ester hydrolase n=1 Tax=Coleophoma cylindrospora TaxID=1849047 RepID=A0A3D8RUZ1_9HELO|nr:hypothetical protein BP6252_05851 [Coleophoma cylindrospora]
MQGGGLSHAIFLLAATLAASRTVVADSTGGTPIVDLGYATHQASLSISNQSNVYYNFSNIRYAAPPVGNLRFEATQPPLNNRSAGIQDGSYGNICPQAYAEWQLGALSLLDGAPNENEDCLFADVIVPKSIYDNKSLNQSRSVPVIVWFYGGGYTLGSKYSAGNPTGLLDQSLNTSTGGQIFVSFNYRLGAFGWMNGPEFAAAGTPNAGFYDQRTLLLWVQKYISLFGGDPDHVTVMGESAGAGSILHQITAYGGVEAPFRQAIMQSPAFIPKSLKNQTNTAFEAFLAAANVTTLAEARLLDSKVLQKANKLVQATAFYGSFNFGPAPDGTFVPDLPGKLLLEGKFDHNLTIIAAHNSNEAGHYTPPTATNSDNFTTFMLDYFPELSTSQLTYLTTVLYPAIYNGSQPYTTPFKRLDLAISDFTFTCSTNSLGRAFGNSTHNYQFSVPPGNHTEDVPYTFFNGPISTVKNDTLAMTLQRYLTGFSAKGTPNQAGLPYWTEYGSAGKALNFNVTESNSVSLDTIVDTATVNIRCDWWQQGLYGDDY